MSVPTLRDLPQAPDGRRGWPWTEVPGRTIVPDRGAWPRISIVTPSYNQGHYLEYTIRSVLLQGYPDLEYIIIDGGSSDASVSIIKKYERWLHYWVSEKDQGQSHAINKGFEHATGAVFGWLNSDDYFLPDAFSRLMEVRKSNPNSLAWVGECLVLDGQDDYLYTHQPRVGDSRFMADWGEKGYIYQPACLFDAQAFGKAGGLVEQFHYCMDVDLWIRLASQGSFVTLAYPVACARQYPETKTLRDPCVVEAELMAVAVLRGFHALAGQRLRFQAIKRLSLPEMLRCFSFDHILDSFSCGALTRMVSLYAVRRWARGARWRGRCLWRSLKMWRHSESAREVK